MITIALERYYLTTITYFITKDSRFFIGSETNKIRYVYGGIDLDNGYWKRFKI